MKSATAGMPTTQTNNLRYEICQDDMPNNHGEFVFCLCCQYDLRATNSRRCPECGAEFDKLDSRTYMILLPPPWILKALPKSRSALWIAILVATLGTLWEFRLPGMKINNIEMVPWLFIYGAFIAIVVLHNLLRLILLRFKGGDERLCKPWLMMKYFFVVVITFVLIACEIPLLVSFHLSRPFFESEVASSKRFSEGWLGIYYVYAIEQDNSCTHVRVYGDSGFVLTKQDDPVTGKSRSSWKIQVVSLHTYPID